METERYKPPPNRTRAFFLSLLPSATLQLSPQVIPLAPASQQAAGRHLRQGENKRGCNTDSVQMTVSPGLQLLWEDKVVKFYERTEVNLFSRGLSGKSKDLF